MDEADLHDSAATLRSARPATVCATMHPSANAEQACVSSRTHTAHARSLVSRMIQQSQRKHAGACGVEVGVSCRWPNTDSTSTRPSMAVCSRCPPSTVQSADVHNRASSMHKVQLVSCKYCASWTPQTTQKEDELAMTGPMLRVAVR